MYPNNHGISGVDQLLGFMAGLVGIMVGVLIIAIGGLCKVPVLLVQTLKQKQISSGEATPTEVSKRQEDEGRSDPNLQGGADRVQMFKLGDLATVHCRFYMDDDLITRTVVMLDADAAKKHGRRITLDALKLSATDQGRLVDMTESEVRKLVEVQLPPTASTVVRKEVPVAEEVVETPDAVSAPEPEARAFMRKPRKGLAAYTGVLLSCGVVPQRRGNRTFDCYSITIDDEALGTHQQLSGTDLERALAESGASAGDRVRVEVVGETPTVVKGRPATKKIWQVTKL
ncbi:hypothetical protein TMEC54S_00361 [Thauera mechernichensis]|uniref:hypothetical protein n=1 Tax=Thauera sp. 27 TaxID=305700 RepID=UPI0002CE858C|nr:hypothetical protein [Thauera sp. 27]ENO77563.1 hypothetical protein B447_15426 [Thauera sp. 27]